MPDDACESILTDLLTQNAELILSNPRRVTLTTAAWTQLLTPEPLRLAAVFAPVASAGGILVSPHSLPPAPVSYGPTTTLPTVLHAAVYPLLISGGWWGTSGADLEVIVYDVIRRT